MLICAYSSYLFGQESGYVYAQVTDKNKVGIPYANVILNAKAGFVSDSLGNFRIPSGTTRSVSISAIGFKNKFILADNITHKSTIILEDSVFQLREIIVKSGNINTTRVGYHKGKIISESYKVSYNFQEAIYITNPEKLSGQIKTINLKAAFRGNPKLPLRINVYEVNQDKLPGKNLLSKPIFIKPVQSLKWFNIDVTDQNLRFPPEGIVIGIEILNPSLTTKTLDTFFTPLIGFYKSESYQRFIKSDFTHRWIRTNWKTIPAVYLEIE